jgi:hypothetical protein
MKEILAFLFSDGFAVPGLGGVMPGGETKGWVLIYSFAVFEKSYLGGLRNMFFELPPLLGMGLLDGDTSPLPFFFID